MSATISQAAGQHSPRHGAGSTLLSRWGGCALAALLCAFGQSGAQTAMQGFDCDISVQYWEYPYSGGALGFSRDGVPQSVVQANQTDDGSIGWQIRVYSNHAVYGGNRFKKPIVISQGFDPSFGLSGEETTLESFSDDLKTTLNENTLTPISPSVEPTLINQLVNDGYEVILVRYELPNAAIAANAWALQGVIWHVNANSASRLTPIRIIGPSMGGLVARYAVKSFAERFTGRLPPVSHLISFDTPNRGAVIPISIQAFLLYTSYYDRNAAISAFWKNLTSPAAKSMLLYYAKPSNGYGPETDEGEQLITDYESSASEHGQFMDDINSAQSLAALKDFHKRSYGNRKLRYSAVASGSGNGTTLGLPAHTFYMKFWAEKEFSDWWEPNVDVAEMYFYSSGENARRKVYDGDLDAWFRNNGQDDWDFYFKEPAFVENAPGGKRGSYNQIREEWGANEDGYNSQVHNWNAAFAAGHAFIPTFSALGLSRAQGYSANTPSNWTKSWSTEPNLASKTIFERVYLPVENQPHCAITVQNKAWFNAELGAINPSSLPSAILSLILN